MAAPRILLVEDEPFILRSLSIVLTESGFEVFETGDGGEAVDLIHHEHPEVVVLDVATLRRDDGRALGEFRRGGILATGVPGHVILLTGNGEPADRELGIELGAEEFVAKPFSPTFVACRARELLAAGGTRCGTP